MHERFSRRQTDRQTTDGQHIVNVNVSSRSLIIAHIELQKSCYNINIQPKLRCMFYIYDFST